MTMLFANLSKFKEAKVVHTVNYFKRKPFIIGHFIVFRNSYTSSTNNLIYILFLFRCDMMEKTIEAEVALRTVVYFLFDFREVSK